MMLTLMPEPDGGKGASPLYVAIESLSESHPVAKFLLENGAIKHRARTLSG
jgi:hypothetical protein